MQDQDWSKKLSPEQYKVLREKETEKPFSGKYLTHNKNGIYMCAGCGQELFSSTSKYESTEPGLIGWPSFSKLIQNEAVKLIPDNTLGATRTEVVCANCGGHLGHVFEANDSPTGQHYCINSVSLDFKETKK